MTRCEIKFCREDSFLQYYGHPIGERCWKKHCDDGNSFNLKKELMIDDRK